MIDLLRAEWMKAVKNTPVISFLIWILPIGVTAGFGLFTLTGFLSESMLSAIDDFSSGQWTTDMLVIWTTVTAFPANIFGRLMPLAFLVVGFAGEYQWGTWKNILPRTHRAHLILSKLAILVSIVVLSLLLTSLALGAMGSVSHVVHDLPYGPQLSAEVLKDFLNHYAQAALPAVISVVILGGYGALAGIITRSILGGLLVSFFLSALDGTSLMGLSFLARLINNPSVINLYLFTPSYNLSNIASWFENGRAHILGPGFTAAPGVGVSLAILIAWVIGLVGSAIVVFQRQDITS